MKKICFSASNKLAKDSKGYYQGFEPVQVETLEELGEYMLTHSLCPQLFGAENTATKNGHMVPYRKAIDNIEGHGDIVNMDIDNTENRKDANGEWILEEGTQSRKKFRVTNPVNLEQIVSEFKRLGWGCVITQSKNSKPEWEKFHISAFTEESVPDHKTFAMQYIKLCSVLQVLQLDMALKNSVQNLTPAVGREVLRVIPGAPIPFHDLPKCEEVETLTTGGNGGTVPEVKYDPKVHNLHLEGNGVSLSMIELLRVVKDAPGEYVRCGCFNDKSHGGNSDSGCYANRTDKGNYICVCRGCNEKIYLRSVEFLDEDGAVVEVDFTAIEVFVSEWNEKVLEEPTAIFTDFKKVGHQLLRAAMVSELAYKQVKLIYSGLKKCSVTQRKEATQIEFRKLSEDPMVKFIERYEPMGKEEREQGVIMLSEISGIGIPKIRSFFGDETQEKSKAEVKGQYYMCGTCYYAHYDNKLIENINLQGLYIIMGQNGVIKERENNIKVVTKVERSVSFLECSDVTVKGDVLHIKVNPMDDWDLETVPDQVIVDDYCEIMDGKIDDFIHLCTGTLIHNETKKNKILITGASNKGKTGMINLLQPTLISASTFYKILEKDTGLSVEDSTLLKSSGILLIDEVSSHIHPEIKVATNNIPLRVMGKGSETHPMDLCFFTSTHASVIDSAASEMRNRLLWLPIGSPKRLITNSAVYIDSKGTEYEENTKLYLQQRFAEALKNPISKKEFLKLQEKYALPEQNDRDDFIDMVRNTVIKKLQDLFKNNLFDDKIKANKKGLVFKTQLTLKELVWDAFKAQNSDVYIDYVKESADMVAEFICEKKDRINAKFNGTRSKHYYVPIKKFEDSKL